MKRILIVRSVSLQQLDKNLPVIRKQFPDAALYLLTHEHARAAAEKYADLAGVWVYPHAGNFRRGKYRPPVPDLDEVLTPVSNLSGAGFLNVLLFSQSIPARGHWICNLAGEIRPISGARLAWLGVAHLLNRGLALLGTLVLFPFLLLWLMLVLPLLGRRRADV